MNHNLLLIAFPTTDDEPLFWWHVKVGAVQAWGCDPDPLIASQAYGPDAAQGDVRVVVLVPSHLTSIMGHEAISGANESQALAAATMAAKAQSLESEKVHIVSAIDGAGGVVTASVGRDILSSGLVHLQALNIDPDAIIPSGWLLPVAGDGSVSADFGFDQVVRAGNIIAIDDPVFRDLLFADLTDKPIIGDDFDAMLVACHSFGAAGPISLGGQCSG